MQVRRVGKNAASPNSGGHLTLDKDRKSFCWFCRVGHVNGHGIAILGFMCLFLVCLHQDFNRISGVASHMENLMVNIWPNGQHRGHIWRTLTNRRQDYEPLTLYPDSLPSMVVMESSELDGTSKHRG